MKLKQTFASFPLAALLAACSAGAGQGDTLPAGKALYDSFVYTVHVPRADDDGGMVNPILPGCYPDPSICRVDSDYYIINSSFAFYPGVPIWHSTDLLHWERLGYVLNRPSQLSFSDGLRISGGIYASDIKYNPHNKLFYMITTNVDGVGTMYVTTDDPKKGEWSDPVRLPEVGGIDPGFLFDTDGKAYIVNNDAPAGEPLYEGHRAIWIREFDWRAGCVKGAQRVIINGGVDISKHPIWIEGPHLYHINGRYYLMAAEGGTGDEHSEVVFSAGSPYGPFKPCAVNPILTQRDLPADRPHPVTCAGHADLVETPWGDWYAVFLAVRPYHGGHDVMGRETFMLPVTWEEGQPVILPAGSVINYQNRPLAPTPLWTADGLSDEAFFIRSPREAFFTIDESGRLELDARDVALDSGKQPSVIGRWITNNVFEAETALLFNPQSADDFAGIALFHNDGSNIRFGKTHDGQGKPCLKLIAYSNGELYTEISVPLSKREAKRKLWLKVSGDEVVNYTFSYTFNPDAGWRQAGSPIPADLLSTHTSGGFTGTMAGIYATATGNE
ncbi:MAG: glycoside hydrolase family 43 protein [Prevotellaceae bacterium]|nr:glycoside hydrolase family 43 protein [Prevotellaceae bacterium]